MGDHGSYSDNQKPLLCACDIDVLLSRMALSEKLSARTGRSEVKVRPNLLALCRLREIVSSRQPIGGQSAGVLVTQNSYWSSVL